MSDEVFEKYKIRGKFRERVMGGKPANPDVLRTFLVKRGVTAETLESAQELIEESRKQTTFEGVEENSTCVFLRDERGIYFEPKIFQGVLRDAMEIQKSITSWRVKFNQGIFVEPPRIYLKRDGAYLKQGDGFHQGPVHSESSFGAPQNSWGASEYLNQPEFEFDLEIAKQKGTPILNEDVLRRALDLAGKIGVGNKHSQGEGRFIAEIVK